MGLSIFKIILICATFFSCSMGIEEFKVVDVHLDDDVEIIFNYQPRGSTVLEALKIFEDDELISGDLKILDTKIIFSPNKPFRECSNIVIEIDKTVESIDGMQPNSIYRMEYTRKIDTVKPKVVLFTEPKTTEDSMLIQFNKKIDVKSFDAAFSLKPTVRYIISYLDDSTAEIVFMNKLKTNTRYEIKIAKSLQDGKYNFMENDYYATFTLVKELIYPEITGYRYTDENKTILLEQNVLYTEWSFNEKLFFESNVPLDMETLQSKIAIYPSVDYDLVYDKYTKDSFSILLKNIPFGKEYKVILKRGIASQEGNCSEKELCYKLITNNPKEKPPKILVGILDFFNGEYFIVGEESIYSQLNLNIFDFPIVFENEQKKIDFYLLVSISDFAETIELLSVFKSLDIDVSNGCLSLEIESIQLVDSVSDGIAEIFEKYILQNDISNYTIIQSRLLIQNKAERGILTFSVDSCMQDTLGNTLEEDWVIPINKGF
ncbi:MAG: hypothetical protein E7062_04875 [Spirochaetaceae bacterium]|nr:hypothetical protein [Spirochaetaceae bacterium]